MTFSALPATASRFTSHVAGGGARAALLALLGAAVLLAGCNTMAGVGKDIKAGGEKLEKAADR